MNGSNKLANAELDRQSLLADAGVEGADASQAPWEQIEDGRYMPRRVRGSFRGGVLG